MQAGRVEFGVRYVWSAYGGAATSPAPASSASSASRAGYCCPVRQARTTVATGRPGRLLIAAPNAAILYQTLAKAPLLGDAERALSTRHFLRELNRFGVTSAIDPSGGFQSLAILSADYFTVPDGKIADIEPLYIVAGGRVVYAAGEFEGLDEPFPDIAPGWSPVARYGGFRAGSRAGMALARQLAVMAAAQTDQRSD